MYTYDSILQINGSKGKCTLCSFPVYVLFREIQMHCNESLANN